MLNIPASFIRRHRESFPSTSYPLQPARRQPLVKQTYSAWVNIGNSLKKWHMSTFLCLFLPFVRFLRAYLLDLLSQMPITRKTRSKNCEPWTTSLSSRTYRSRTNAISAPDLARRRATRSGTHKAALTPRGCECRGETRPPLKVRRARTKNENKTSCKDSPRYRRSPSRGLLRFLRAPSHTRTHPLLAAAAAEPCPRPNSAPGLHTTTRRISCLLRTSYHRGLRSSTAARWLPPSWCRRKGRSSAVPQNSPRRRLHSRRRPRIRLRFHRRHSTTYRIR